MKRLEMVEKLITKTNISYEEAKDALDKCHWDILDAILYLEENNVIKAPAIKKYVTDNDETYINKEIKDVLVNNEEKTNEDKKSDVFELFFESICRVIDKGNNIFLQIKRNERILIKLPITIVILCLIFIFWLIVPAFIIGLFINIKYEIIGNDINDEKINNFFSYLSKVANSIKEKKRKGHNND